MGGQNYLIPLNSNIKKERDVAIGAVSANFVLKNLEITDNRMNFVILDACRNNPLTRSFRSATRGLARMDAPRGSLIAYSTGPGEVAVDGAGANSPYTLALAEAMQTPGIPAEQMFKLVRDRVLDETDGEQTPWEESSLTGADFYFNVDVPVTVETPGTAATSDTAAATQQETVFWQSIKDTTEAANFQAYLSQYPEGTFASLAKIRLSAATAAAKAETRRSAAEQEARRQAEAQRLAAEEETRRLAEAEAQRLAVELEAQRQAEEARVAEEKRLAEAEAKRLAEEDARLAEERRIAIQKEDDARAAREELALIARTAEEARKEQEALELAQQLAAEQAAEAETKVLEAESEAKETMEDLLNELAKQQALLDKMLADAPTRAAEEEAPRKESEFVVAKLTEPTTKMDIEQLKNKWQLRAAITGTYSVKHRSSGRRMTSLKFLRVVEVIDDDLFKLEISFQISVWNTISGPPTKAIVLVQKIGRAYKIIDF